MTLFFEKSLWAISLKKWCEYQAVPYINPPANPILTNFTYSESLSILPLSESKNETLHKYSYVILLFICFEFNGLMKVLIKG